MGEFLPPANPYVVIYPIDEVIPIKETAFVQERFPSAMLIGGDGSRERLTNVCRATVLPATFDAEIGQIGDAAKVRRIRTGRWMHYLLEIGGLQCPFPPNQNMQRTSFALLLTFSVPNPKCASQGCRHAGGHENVTGEEIPNGEIDANR
jgi:hypothetical protein